MRYLTGLVVAAGVWAQPTVTDLLEQRTRELLAGAEKSCECVLGVAAVDLETGEILGRNPDTVFPQASAIKIPIMAEVFRAARAGRLRLEDRVRLEPSDLTGGSGKLKEELKRGPVERSVRELVELMIRDSDNVATNKLIAMVGMEEVNRTLDGLGLHRTRLRRRMMDIAAATRDEENVSTPREMARLAEMLYRGRLADEAASREMIEIMKTVKGSMRKTIPAEIAVAAKPGELPGVRTETGIVFLPGRPFVLSVMGTYLPDKLDPLEPVIRIVYEHFVRLANANRYGHRVR
jgi:beta-lactamase class A